MIELEYKKRFIGNLLRGLEMQGTLKFDSEKAAQKFIKETKQISKKSDRFIAWEFRLIRTSSENPDPFRVGDEWRI